MIALRPLRFTAVLAAALCLGVALSGCISVFPKSKPAQLYQFGQTAPPPAEAAPGQAGFAVATAFTGFDRAAATDRILTVNGGEVAYIKDARWAANAVALFDQALQRAFDADPGPARLVSRGEMGRRDYLLKLDVRRFEAEYRNGADSPPTVVVEVHASLDRMSDRVNAAEHLFRAEVGAGDNRVGPIAGAFDKATSQVVGQIVNWVDAKGAT